MSRPSVSTWALHSLIGTCSAGRPGDPQGRIMESKQGTLDLLDVPAALAEHGFKTMELCHFHIPSTSPDYIQKLRQRIEDNGVELWSTLIDDGDINHPETGDRDREWTTEWIRRAGVLGSKCVRVVAGKQPYTSDSIAYSAEQLLKLTSIADEYGIKILTENWFETLATPAAVDELFSLTDNKVGLCFDFGNWGGPDKYEKLEAIAKYATSCHAKCNYIDGKPDLVDYERCIAITNEVGFDGPYTLVYGESSVVWESLDEQRSLLGFRNYPN